MATNVKPPNMMKRSPLLQKMKQALQGTPPEGQPISASGLPPILKNKGGQPIGGAEPAKPQVRGPLKPKSASKRNIKTGKQYGFLKG